MNGHHVKQDWMGHETTTLRDLWPQPVRAIIVGINPAPVSRSVSKRGLTTREIWDKVFFAVCGRPDYCRRRRRPSKTTRLLPEGSASLTS